MSVICPGSFKSLFVSGPHLVDFPVATVAEAKNLLSLWFGWLPVAAMDIHTASPVGTPGVGPQRKHCKICRKIIFKEVMFCFYQ